MIEQVREELASTIRSLSADLEGLVTEWVPEMDREQISERLIMLVPEKCEYTIRSRTSHAKTISFGLSIVDPLTQSSESDTASDNHELVELIIDGLLGKRTTGSLRAYCSQIEQPLLTSHKDWREYRMFGTVLRIIIEA